MALHAEPCHAVIPRADKGEGDEVEGGVDHMSRASGEGRCGEWSWLGNLVADPLPIAPEHSAATATYPKFALLVALGRGKGSQPRWQPTKFRPLKWAL